MCIFMHEDRCIKNGGPCPGCDSAQPWPSQEIKQKVIKHQQRPVDELLTRLRLLTSRMEKAFEGSYYLDGQDLKPLIEKLEAYCDKRKAKSQAVRA